MNFFLSKIVTDINYRSINLAIQMTLPGGGKGFREGRNPRAAGAATGAACGNVRIGGQLAVGMARASAAGAMEGMCCVRICFCRDIGLMHTQYITSFVRYFGTQVIVCCLMLSFFFIFDHIELRLIKLSDARSEAPR